MEHSEYRIYKYRWVVLPVFMIVVIFNQLLWITFAPITVSAAEYYRVSDMSIGMLSMSFMIAYLAMSIPASWVIDTYGFKTSVLIGTLLTGIFGLMRGLVSSNYKLVLIAQIGIAIGQPFILNAVTKVAARWFPIEERASASGLGTLAMYVGILLGMVVTPLVTVRTSISHMLLWYGIGAMTAAILFLILAHEYPPSPPGPPELEERALMFDGLKQALRKRNFLLLMFIFFIGLGIFNAVSTWIEDILRPRGFSIDQAGYAGGLMILGGIIGAIILPTLSDKKRRRVPFIILSLAGSIPALAGITYAHTMLYLMLSSFFLGFFLLSAGPIGFQYGAEIARPTPEGTSNGLLLLMGQISGIAFIFGMDIFKIHSTGSMTPSLLGLIFLMSVCMVISTRLHESSLLQNDTAGRKL